MSVAPSDLFGNSRGNRIGVVTGGAEVGRTAQGDRTMDTKTEARGETVDEETGEVLVGMVGQKGG